MDIIFEFVLPILVAVGACWWIGLVISCVDIGYKRVKKKQDEAGANTADESYKRWESADIFLTTCIVLAEMDERRGRCHLTIGELNEFQDKLREKGYAIQKIK